MACHMDEVQKVVGSFDCAIQRAPAVKKEDTWLTRPLTYSKTTLIIRCLLGCNEKSLTSLSLKATCLAWAAKAELPRDQRRLLGLHASAIQDADSVYAPDLAFAPVHSLQRFLALIKNSSAVQDQCHGRF